MFAMHWPSLLSLFLWMSPHVLLGIIAVILCKRRLYRSFPCFLAYVLCEIAEFILLFALRAAPSVSGEQYAYAYYSTLALSVVLRFGVIDEVSRDLFRESQFLQKAARRSLRLVTGLLLLISILLAVYAPGGNGARFIAGISVVNRGAALVQCGLLLSLLLFANFLGLTWCRATFGIMLGLGVLTSVDLGTFAVRAEFSSRALVPYLNLLRSGTGLVCALIWIGYLLVRELSASFTIVSRDEVEIWNTELQHLVRH
jgi:hypothetical protein